MALPPNSWILLEGPDPGTRAGTRDSESLTSLVLEMTPETPPRRLQDLLQRLQDRLFWNLEHRGKAPVYRELLETVLESLEKILESSRRSSRESSR